MRIAIAADHAGFTLKEQLQRTLAGEGHEAIDFGPSASDACDYPGFAQAVARDVAQGRADRGILVCATGIGMAMAANKIDGVRAAPAQSEEQARLTREHNDANVLTLGAKYVDQARAAAMARAFSRHRIRRRTPRPPRRQNRAVGTQAVSGGDHENIGTDRAPALAG